MSRYGLSSCGWRNLILFLRKMHMHKICSDSEFPTKAPHCFPFTLSPHTSIYERVWPRTKKMDWTKCRVTPDSGIFKQTLPWCHGDQEVELTAILADLHLVVCPNLPGEAPAWPVTTVSGPNNTGISLGKKKNKKKHTGLRRFTEQTRRAVPNTSGSHISQSLSRLPFFPLWPCQSAALRG